MNIRHIALAAVSLAALSPSLCNATPEKTSVNACARAFAASVASPGAAPPAFKLSYGGNLTTGSVVDFFTTEYTFELEARDPKSGLPVARARCSTDSRGTVVSLSAMPLQGKGAVPAPGL